MTKKAARWTGPTIALVAVAAYLLAASAGAVPQPQHLTLTVTNMGSILGYMQADGVAQNDGVLPVHNPTIRLEAYDSSGTVVLAATQAQAAGQAGRYMGRGTAAAFHLGLFLPFPPPGVRWSVSADNVPYDVIYPR